MIVNFFKNRLKEILSPKWINKYRDLITYYRNIIESGRIFGNINTKRYWDKKLSTFRSFWRDESYLCFDGFFPKNESFSLLDVGCALGDGTERLNQFFPMAKIFGADFSAVAIKKAKEKGSKVKYFLLDIEKDPIPGIYDYVTIIETLEHLNKPYEIIEKCLNHVRKALWISVPLSNDDCPLKNEGKTVNVGEHVYNFKKDSFKDYKARVVLIDKINDGQMPRIVFEIIP